MLCELPADSLKSGGPVDRYCYIWLFMWVPRWNLGHRRAYMVSWAGLPASLLAPLVFDGIALSLLWVPVGRHLVLLVTFEEASKGWDYLICNPAVLLSGDTGDTGPGCACTQVTLSSLCMSLSGQEFLC